MLSLQDILCKLGRHNYDRGRCMEYLYNPDTLEADWYPPEYEPANRMLVFGEEYPEFSNPRYLTPKVYRCENCSATTEGVTRP